MPAQVAIIHQDEKVAKLLSEAIQANGYTVHAFSDPLLALTTLERANRFALLITCVAFAGGKPHGLSIALMARMRRPEIKLIFLVHPEECDHVRHLGECMALPVDAQNLAGLANRMLAENHDRVRNRGAEK